LKDSFKVVLFKSKVETYHHLKTTALKHIVEARFFGYQVNAVKL